MTKKKELELELLGVNGLDPWLAHNSSPRKQMFAAHIGQAPVINGNEPRRNMTGVELEYARYTFDVRFPVDAVVLRNGVFNKYQPGVGINAIRKNPETFILYEHFHDRNKRVGVLRVPTFASMHQDFGFRYHVRKDALDRATKPGSHIEKDTVLATSSAVKENGLYGLGIEANAIFISDPGTIEDGFVVSRELLKRIRPTGYQDYEANWGQKLFPLNLYGDDQNYKPFPDIGEKIRDDGLVFALREFDQQLAVVEMTPAALRTVDREFDYMIHGAPGSTVVDITVYHDTDLPVSPTPSGMTDQPMKYYRQQAAFYTKLLDRYKQLEKERGKTLRITPELNQLLFEAQVYLPSKQKRKLTRMKRLEKLDEWFVKVTCEREMDPTDAFKLTDTHGGSNAR